MKIIVIDYCKYPVLKVARPRRDETQLLSSTLYINIYSILISSILKANTSTWHSEKRKHLSQE